MKKVIPFFSARINSADAYSRFFHTRAYLGQRSALFQGAEADRRLMAAVGYKRFEKFVRRRRAWDGLCRPIPLSYLAAVDASLGVMFAALEADLQEFQVALTCVRVPRSGIVRYIPGFYGSVDLPSGLTEAEAVALITAHSKNTRHECCLNFVGLKAIFVKPDGSTSTSYFPPRLRVSNGFLAPSGGGEAIGTCSL